MKKILEKLQKRPDHEKNRIIKIMALIVTILIFIVYLFLISLKPSSISIDQDETTARDAIDELLDNTIESFAQVNEDIKNQKEQIAESVIETQENDVEQPEEELSEDQI